MKRLFASTLCVCAVLACSKAPAPTASAAGPTARAQPGAPVGQGSISGTVAETMDAAGYSYVRLSTASGDVWAAIPEATLQRGQAATIAPQMVNENFHSKTLNRTFDRLIFGTLINGGPTAGAQAGSAALPAGHPAMGSMGLGAMGMGSTQGAHGSAAAADVKVPRAEGPNAKTVAELWADRKALENGQVAVRGKVVKFLPQILGKNWVHLHDGSGSAADKTNDLTVTTQDAANVGDVVTATGTVHVDKDYGAGYAYPVILEEAKLSR